MTPGLALTEAVDMAHEILAADPTLCECNPRLVQGFLVARKTLTPL
jgi:hypothetical protein